MDGQQFDRLTLRLSQATSRRRFGAVLAALGLGATLSMPREAVAKRKKKKKKPKACAGGTVRCGTVCVNTKSNALHCGGCGNRCGNNNACVDSTCQGGCPGNQILCVGLCVDPGDNEEHCGDCDTKCTGDLTCLNGQCGCADGTRCGNECVNTQTDPDHCGGCNTPPCANNETCQGGQCVATGCPAGQRSCGGGVCIPDDIDHCCTTDDPACGVGQYNQIMCNSSTHRCVCKTAGYGICQRFANNAGTCGPCCAGATVDPPCSGDYVCVGQSCACPQGQGACPYHAGVCATNPGYDPNCCALDPSGTPSYDPCPANFGCWCGYCRRGCRPSPQGGQGCGATPGQQCGSSCTLCPQDAPYCCETGPGEAGCSADRYCGG